MCSRSAPGSPSTCSSPRIPHPRGDTVDCHDERVVQPRIVIALTKSSDHLDLHQVDRIHVWIPHVDRAPQHWISFQQDAVTGDLQQRGYGARQSIAKLVPERSQRVGHELSIVFSRDASVGLREHHLEQVHRRSEVRPLAIHRPKLIELAALERTLEGLLEPEPRCEQQARLCPGELPRDRPQSLEPRRQPAVAQAGFRC